MVLRMKHKISIGIETRIPEFTFGEIENIIKKFKKKGNDKILDEHMKFAGVKLCQELTKLLIIYSLHKRYQNRGKDQILYEDCPKSLAQVITKMKKFIFDEKL